GRHTRAEAFRLREAWRRIAGTGYPGRTAKWRRRRAGEQVSLASARLDRRPTIRGARPEDCRSRSWPCRPFLRARPRHHGIPRYRLRSQRDGGRHDVSRHPGIPVATLNHREGDLEDSRTGCGVQVQYAIDTRFRAETVARDGI